MPFWMQKLTNRCKLSVTHVTQFVMAHTWLFIGALALAGIMTTLPFPCNPDLSAEDTIGWYVGLPPYICLEQVFLQRHQSTDTYGYEK